MKLSLRSQATAVPPGVVGSARVERRVDAVLPRLSSGDVAVIDHLDLDRGLAEALLDRGVVAVVDASLLVSGRYPNLGPEVLARAGVVLVDGVGSAVFGALRDGTRVRIHDGCVVAGDRIVASGRQLDLEQVQQLMAGAREGLVSHLQAFTHNTTEFLRQEEQLLLHGAGLPRLDVPMAGRPVVVVASGSDQHADLRRLRPYLREQKPLLVGVDGGADALLAARLVPDVVVVGEGASSDAWDTSGISDAALTAAQEVVLHCTAQGPSAGAARLDQLGIRAQRVLSGGTSEDVALLLADAHEASVILTVGAHTTLEELLDRQRAGLSSSFLTRLKVGPRLVDAGTVPSLYVGGARWWQLVLVLLAGLVALLAALVLTPQGAPVAEQVAELARTLVDRLGAQAGGLLP